MRKSVASLKGTGSCGPSKRVKPDTISIVEAAYNCESDARTWLDRLLEQAMPKLDRGFGVVVSIYEPGAAPDRMLVASRYIDEKLFASIMRMSLAYPEDFQRANSAPIVMGTVTETLQITADDARRFLPF